MKSASAQGRESGHGWLLRNLIESVPHARAAVLLSSDGLATAAHGLDRDRADQLAAIASGLFSIARTAGAKFGNSGDVRQIVAELDDALLFVSAAGHRSLLTVLAGREADAGVLGYEMLQAVKGVGSFLATPARGNGGGDQAGQA
jgi:predicted regulator of Ras-like GTPase activity (Roadblock/LC7/MglB family)